MLLYYLWLIPCFRAVLISAAREESEHVHIKVLVPDVTRKHTHSHRVRQYQHHKQHPILQHIHYPAKPPIHSTTAIHTSAPYEYDVFGFDEAGGGGGGGSVGYGTSAKSLMPEESMDGIDSYGPVLFNNDVATSAVNTQHPAMSKQLMRQLFTPEMMSALTGKEDTSHELNDVNSHLTGMDVGRLSALENKDLLSEYLQQFNKQQAQITAPTFFTTTTNKRKKFSYAGRGEQQRQQQHQLLKEQAEFQPYFSTSITQYPTTQIQQEHRIQQKQQRKQQIRQSPYQRYQQRHQNFNPLQYGSEDDSDEFETAEDISSSASDSNEDMTTAFNKLQPISYQDMFGEYATPLLTSGTSQHGLSFQQQATEPTYSTDWRQYHHQAQYQHQRPEVQKKQQKLLQQQHHYKQKQKSQQTQFVLPSTTLRLTTSSASSSSSPSSTLPISSGFTGGSITSTGTLPWTLPYEFVEQSQHQQQQHQPQQQQLDAQQYQHKQQKSPSYKKRKNRNRRKRTRIIVE